MNTPTKEVLMPVPTDRLSPADIEERTERFARQIDLVLTNVGAMGELPDYLVPANAKVRQAVAERYRSAGWEVEEGVEESPYLRIASANENEDDNDNDNDNHDDPNR